MALDPVHRQPVRERENATCLITQVQNGPAEPSLLAHRITCFRSYSRLCWDLLSVLELRGCAGCRACAHLLGKRNCHHSELRWGNPVSRLRAECLEFVSRLI